MSARADVVAGALTSDRWMPATTNSITAICSIADPAIRNLWITQTYADFAARLSARLSPDQTWCSFATWASNTAGTSIREREVPRVLIELTPEAHRHLDRAVEAGNDHHPFWLRLGVVDRLRRGHLESLLGEALNQVSQHIAHGNTLVFSELAPLFVGLLDRLDAGDAPPDTGHIPTWLDEIGVPTERDAPLVRAAFTSYARAIDVVARPSADGDDDAVAEAVLAGNISAVLHEQQRLQDDLAASLDAGLLDVGRTVEELVDRWVPGFVRRWIARRAAARAEIHIERFWDRVVTETLLTLSVPGEVLHLSRDVPLLPDGARWPTALAEPVSPTLVDLLRRWDRTDGTGIGSAAADWADLGDRMGYIVNLFRSRQRSDDLTSEPFTDDQLATMRELRVPDSLL